MALEATATREQMPTESMPLAATERAELIYLQSHADEPHATVTTAPHERDRGARDGRRGETAEGVPRA